MTTPFFETPGLLPAFVALNRSRAVGAGVDPFEYDRVTMQLESLYDWPDALAEAGRAHIAAADGAATAGHTVSAAASLRTAARWLHLATVLPHPDRAASAEREHAADAAMGRALALAEPDTAERIDGPGFTGWLRRPPGTGTAPVVLIAPGLDSSKEEFHVLADALLERGVAVAAFDGPGQGLNAVASAPEPAYDKVVAAVLDAVEQAGGVDPSRMGLIGMSLGTFGAAVAAAREPRLRAAAGVSGPYRLHWSELPPFVTETLAQRCGSPDAAREFVRHVDLAAVAPRIRVPFLVVDGGTDVTPGVESGAPLAAAAPRGEYLLVPHGDHLLGNAQADWLPYTADWLSARLGPDMRFRAATVPVPERP